MAQTKINQAAITRILNSPYGQAILDTFFGLEEELIERGGTNFFGQIGFMLPGDPINEGDLIPTIHFSLQPFQPVLSEPVELVAGVDESE